MEKTMDNWKFRDELYRSLNQWYFILAFIFIGAFIGYVLAYISPAPYQATADMYIGIDVVRVNAMEYIIPLAKDEPLNLDDYKNWQLKQVADIFKSDEVLTKTLTNLQQQDNVWESYTLAELRKAIDIYWYDTGIWRLEVTLPIEAHSAFAVETWLDTGYEKISDLLIISLAGAEIDQQIWSINLAVSDKKLQRAKLLNTSKSVSEWLATLEELSPGTKLEESMYSDFVNWIVIHQLEELFSLDSLNGTPESDHNAEFIIHWFNNVDSLLILKSEQIENELNILNSDREKLLPEYHEFLQDSLGLSANIVLLPNTSGVEVNQVYTLDTFVLGGSFLGLMMWLIYSVLRIRKNEGNNAE